MRFLKVLAEKYNVVPKEAEGDYYGYSLGLNDIKGIKPGSLEYPGSLKAECPG